ncbi:Gfo/Idh/MocA family oxidoreductase [Phenylobacterium sp.]|jgi:predicted dehydrogenase|uniref:Gfo/Idh/MocA family protein n=1 Tax=Phenylobacterium sp. TaxID=1871053 RepID=UPI002F421F20
MTKKLRVGLIGANPGGAVAATTKGVAPYTSSGESWGAISHVPALRSLPGYEIAAVCTSRPETAAAAATAFGVSRSFHDFRQMAQDPDVDIVAVSVRVPFHHPMVMAALDAGKHVFCEPPFALNLADAEEMAAAAKKQGVCALLGLQFRVDPAMLHLQELLAEGYLGEVRTVHMTMYSPGAIDERPADRMWHGDRKNGAGVTIIRANHTLDGLCFALGDFTEVAARVETRLKRWRNTDTGEWHDVDAPDHIMVNGVLEGGALVSALVAHVPHNSPGYRMEIYGSRGTLVLSSTISPQWVPCVVMGSRDGAPLEELPTPQRFREAPPETPDGPPLNVAHLYQRLEQAIRTGAPVDPGFEVGVARHRLLDALQRSSDEGRTIRLE